MEGDPELDSDSGDNSGPEDWDDVLALLQTRGHCVGQQPLIPTESEETQEDDDWDGVLSQLVAQQHHQQTHAGNDPNNAVVSSNSNQTPDADICVFGPNMFGNSQVLQEIGNELQRCMFATFRSFAQQQPETAQKPSATWREFVRHGHGRNAFRSQSSIAKAAAVAFSKVFDKMIHVACLLLYGTGFLFGAFVCAWCELFQKRKYEAVASISRVKYDETPLKLRVAEYETVMGCPLPVSYLQRRKKLQSNEEAYCHAKIFRVLWKYGT